MSAGNRPQTAETGTFTNPTSALNKPHRPEHAATTVENVAGPLLLMWAERAGSVRSSLVLTHSTAVHSLQTTAMTAGLRLNHDHLPLYFQSPME